jgi:4'-phosphopantetheinyl transferase EntD
MWTTPVLPEEEILISQANKKRQREFRAGRHCAHTALERLGLARSPILREKNRAPIWPEGYHGSISHCMDFCLAACCARGSIRGLGIDVEPLQPLKAGLQPYIQTQNESAFMQAHPELPERLVFSAKESIYKCFYPLVKRFFGFHAVELKLKPISQTFSFTINLDADIELPGENAFHGFFVTTESHLITACYLQDHRKGSA